MFREIITSSITLANSGTVIGGNIAPAVSGLTVNGDVSATGKIYGTFGNTTIQTLLSSISLSGIKGELKLDQLSAGGASLSDILKYQELVPGVSAWAPSRVLIGELSASGTLTNGSLVTYSEADNRDDGENRLNHFGMLIDSDRDLSINGVNLALSVGVVSDYS